MSHFTQKYVRYYLLLSLCRKTFANLIFRCFQRYEIVNGIVEVEGITDEASEGMGFMDFSVNFVVL